MTEQTAGSATWWAALKHGGMLVAPGRLEDHFGDGLPPLPRWTVSHLRRDVIRMADGDREQLTPLLDTVLEEVLGLGTSGAGAARAASNDGTASDGQLPAGEWLKGPAVGSEWSHRALTGELVKPRRVWRGPRGMALPLFIADQSLGSRGRGLVKRVGIGRGRRPVSRVIEWLRHREHDVALLTNGRQWRLIHAGADYDAWCEWDIDLWFEEGAPGPQVTALRRLLGRQALVAPAPDEDPPLVAAIEASRRGQAQLSDALGERVRQAIEDLIRVSSPALEPLDEAGVPRQAIYIAATRLVMRCVVILFAESRDLLPRESPIYNDAYSLAALRESLERRSGGRAADRLRSSYLAWPRLMALFRLVYHGSSHEALPIPAYGGALFAPGDPTADDPVRRAMAAFEGLSGAATPSDAAVYRVLRLLTRSRVRVRQGRRSTYVEAPVDFSDLSSEYIGILYEGVLDYELRRAPPDEPMVFLNLGDQPALPLGRLENMSDDDLAELLDKLRARSLSVPDADEDADGELGPEELADDADGDEAALEDESEGAEEDDEDLAADADDEPDLEDDADQTRLVRERVLAWARRAVVTAGVVPEPSGSVSAAERLAFEGEVGRAAEALVRRIVGPGGWFLVRWGGTRKGSGTFYTRPQLAGPTARRTLRPLAYEALETEADEETGVDFVSAWRPRSPETILGLTVCDPAMGSGSFLISSLRFLTDALFESLHVHHRLEPGADRTVVRLADGQPADHPANETLPVPVEHAEFEPRLRARLKRHVVERCLYGVDIDPLAVELARLSLWVETMDYHLPFGFLDHKLKAGDSLVGCWLDQFRDYPVMAWERDGGDYNHNRFVHHFREYEKTRGKNKGQLTRSGDAWHRALKDMRKGPVKDEIKRWITSMLGQSLPGFDDVTPSGIHDEALAAFEAIHALPIHEVEARARRYREDFVENPDVAQLRDALDLWCAIWFWPPDALDAVPMPTDFLAPDDETRRIARQVAAERQFFHWELEFPDVFTGPGSGFDAVLGNPPWETLQPNSKEFFSNIDPLYRAYGKQEALDVQVRLFEQHREIERDWITYQQTYKDLANWQTYAASPFGDPEGEGDRFPFSRSPKETETLHRTWRNARADREGFADPEHPFRYQGQGKAYTYKMFLEQAHHLAAEGGRFGLIVPSGIYTDRGSLEVRELLLDRCDWEWLFGFENRDKIFDIDSRFKFCPIIAEKGDTTDDIRAAFMRRDLGEWEQPRPPVLAYPRRRIVQFSPESKAVLEIQSRRDLEVLEKLYDNGVLLGDDSEDGWGITYRQGDFNMTSDSHLFKPRPWWEERGYRSDAYGHWLKGNWRPWDGPASILERPAGTALSVEGDAILDVDAVEDVALPLYQGIMIGHLTSSRRRWVSGTGASATWTETACHEPPGPQYLMGLTDFISESDARQYRIAYRRVARTTDTRTWIGTPLSSTPTGDSVFLMELAQAGLNPVAHLSAVLSSYSYDWVLRQRLGGTNLSWYILAETPAVQVLNESAVSAAVGLALPGTRFASEWLAITSQNTPWQKRWAVTSSERLRLKSLSDALAAELFGLSVSDVGHILRDCDHPVADTTSNTFTRQLNPKGFWRVDKTEDPELRHTVLTQIAFNDLQSKGLERFLAQNDGEGWMIPETVRLADYGLGHDQRAKEHQPVRERLGPRFYDWQLEQGVEESWEECRRHAELIRMIVPVEDDHAEDEPEAAAAEQQPSLGL